MKNLCVPKNGESQQYNLEPQKNNVLLNPVQKSAVPKNQKPKKNIFHAVWLRLAISRHIPPLSAFFTVSPAV
ncbi:MAG: hypothetical protein RBT25_02245, partial [Lentisphaeria bacterium]|nr:hypothetical protein [Lentisphaeria bacterium]